MIRVSISISCSPQADFDDLVSRSPDGVDQAHSLFHRGIPDRFQDDIQQPKSLQHNESIDDVLEKYRPTSNSILDCIACLDEQSLISSSAGREASSSSMLRESTLIEIRDPTISAGAFVTSKPRCVPKRKHFEEPSDHHDTSAKKCSRKRWVMSKKDEKEKEDRRREQNREAQRRYREKHMFPHSKTSLEGIW